VSTDFEYYNLPSNADRIGYIFEETTTSKVYILSNTNVVSAEPEYEREALKGVRKTIEKKTEAKEKGGIEVVETDFYDFKRGLVDVFRILQEELYKDNRVYVNLSGGTKPLAIAMSFACALVEEELSPFYIPKEYGEGENGIESQGVADNPEVSRLDLFNIQNIIPTEKYQQKLLRYLLLSDSEEIGVTDLLMEQGEISPKSKSDDEEERHRIRQTYYERTKKLEELGLIEKNSSKCSLTENGNLIAELLQVEKEAKSE
jgi:hypothetical protein